MNVATHEQKTELKTLPIEYLERGRYQPRRVFDETSLLELAHSIQQQGMIQPIVVRAIAKNRYEILAGERRWRAAQRIALENVPCLICAMDDTQAAAVTTIENIQREDLNPIEEAQSYQQLCEVFAYSREMVAKMVGKSTAKIVNSLRLLRLEDRIQQWLIEGKLSEGHGKVLAALSPPLQMKLANQSIQGQWSVRQLEQAIKKQQRRQPESVDTLDVDYLERLLSTQLQTQVVIKTQRQHEGGWLQIRFHDNEILSGILEKIGVSSDESD